MRVFTSRLVKLEKLQNDELHANEIVANQQWNHLCGTSKYTKKKFKFGDYALWFLKGQKTHLGKFTKKWFGPYKIQFYLLNNTMLLVTLDKFNSNLMLVNVNKLKPYQFLDEKTHTTN